MAFTATAVGRVRVGGADTNGAFYDAGIAGAATDYSDQDAAQATFTNLSCLVADDAGRLVIRDASAGGLFTSAMIGNAIRIHAGTGWVTGYYFITAVGSSDLITVDRSPANGADRTAGSGNVGGAAATIKRVADSANSTGDKCVAGNTIYIQGAGTDTPGSDDYTTTSYFTPVSGNDTAGMVRIVGYNGRPRLKSNGLMFFNATTVWFENLYLTCSSNSNGSIGVINGTCYVYNCVIDTANQTGMQALAVISVISCRIKGGRSAASSGGYGVNLPSTASVVLGCNIEGVGDVAVRINGGNLVSTIAWNRIYGCYSDGVIKTAGNASYFDNIFSNTIDANSGHGISITTTLALQTMRVFSNQITNHAQSGKYGIYIAAGTIALNDRAKGFIDYNNVYGNTTDYGSISAGAHDTSEDPGYVSAATGNHTPAATADGDGWPGQLPGATGSINYVAMGAIQRLVTGGAGPLVGPGRLVR